MRKIMTLSIAVVLALVAIGTWAAATTGSQEQVGFSGERINTLQLMSVSTNLPAEQYEAF
jgi:hypothetical protein